MEQKMKNQFDDSGGIKEKGDWRDRLIAKLQERVATLEFCLEQEKKLAKQEVRESDAHLILGPTGTMVVFNDAVLNNFIEAMCMYLSYEKTDYTISKVKAFIKEIPSSSKLHVR